MQKRSPFFLLWQVVDLSLAKNLNCICVNVQEKDFDLLTELKDIESKKGIMGAVVTFTGQVRLFEKGEEILSLDLEHYPGMTEKYKLL